MSFDRKRVLITGAGSGIGRVTAVRFAAAGAKVALLDVHRERLAEVQAEIEAAGGEALSLPTDVSDEEQIAQAFRQVSERWGSLDFVFSNAGVVGLLTAIEDMPAAEWDRIMSINLRGAFLTVKHAVPLLKNGAEGGSIVITSSIHGNRVFNSYGYFIYASAKAGINAFAKSAALELSKYRIRVNVICPGAIQTHLNDHLVVSPDMQKVIIPVEYPEGKYPFGIGDAGQVADLVEFLASERASYITGAEIHIDGARSLL